MVSPNANTTAAAEGLRQLGGPLERRLPLYTLSLRRGTPTVKGERTAVPTSFSSTANGFGSAVTSMRCSCRCIKATFVASLTEAMQPLQHRAADYDFLTKRNVAELEALLPKAIRMIQESWTKENVADQCAVAIKVQVQNALDGICEKADELALGYI